MNELKKIAEFYNGLLDQESKDIYAQLYKRLIGVATPSDWTNFLISLGKDWKLADYDDFRDVFRQKKVIIFGAGNDGKMTLEILRQYGVDVEGFCDNNFKLWNGLLDGMSVISPDHLLANYRDCIVVIASRKYYLDMFKQLIINPDCPFPKQNIWVPRVGLLYATTGNQYFDCPGMEFGENETFIDAGFFHGETSREFVKLCNGKYNKIIAFEPDEKAIKYYKESCDKIQKLDLVNYASWNVKEKLYFQQTGDGGARINGRSGKVEIQANSIDNILNGEEATFIKLDVEGAEYNTLLGAEKTIKKYKPKLAISIYHKPQDIIEIPLLLMKLRTDYRYYIRHYTTTDWETVLYAY